MRPVSSRLLDAASRYRVVECTGSLSNCGITSRPNSSMDCTTTSVGSVFVVGLKVSWSKPSSAHFCTPMAQSSGSPTTTKPPAAICSTCSGVGSGILFGHSGSPSGFGMLSSQWKASEV